MFVRFAESSERVITLFEYAESWYEGMHMCVLPYKCLVFVCFKTELGAFKESNVTCHTYQISERESAHCAHCHDNRASAGPPSLSRSFTLLPSVP